MDIDTGRLREEQARHQWEANLRAALLEMAAINAQLSAEIEKLKDAQPKGPTDG